MAGLSLQCSIFFHLMLVLMGSLLPPVVGEKPHNCFYRSCFSSSASRGSNETILAALQNQTEETIG